MQINNKLFYIYIIISIISISISILILSYYTFNNNNNNNNNTYDKHNKLYNIHQKIKFIHGSLNEELPLQLIIIEHINPNDKVLELGGNYGRTSCIINYLLNNKINHVVIEPQNDIIPFLTENKNINNFNFKIEDRAISNTELYINNNITKPINEINDYINWRPVKFITWNNFKNKYNINFNVLVVDCKDTLYYILKDNIKILYNIDKIIIKNDFSNIKYKEFIDNLFKLNNFIKIYNESGKYGPCSKFFYEVWKK